MYCASCGAEMTAQASTCEKCGWQVPRTESIGDDPAMRLILPVGRSWLAIVAGYLGLVSIFGISRTAGAAVRHLGGRRH
jgi:uncharacterized protein (DUF983 family)